MEIDVRAEDPLPLPQLAAILPGKPNKETVRRWITQGRMNHHRKVRVKMQRVYLPSGLGSTKEAYYRFLEALNS